MKELSTMGFTLIFLFSVWVVFILLEYQSTGFTNHSTVLNLPQERAAAVRGTELPLFNMAF